MKSKKQKKEQEKSKELVCEVCKEKIELGEQQYLDKDKLVVCQFCYENAIDSDSYGIRPEQFNEYMMEV
jgi:hypothetical protein